jgi:hypothetical protein
VYKCSLLHNIILCYCASFSLQVAHTHNSLGTQSSTDSLGLDNELNLYPTLLLFIYVQRQSEKMLDYSTDCDISCIYNTVLKAAASIAKYLICCSCTLTSIWLQEGGNSSLTIIMSHCYKCLQQYPPTSLQCYNPELTTTQ